MQKLENKEQKSLYPEWIKDARMIGHNHEYDAYETNDGIIWLYYGNCEADWWNPQLWEKATTKTGNHRNTKRCVFLAKSLRERQMPQTRRSTRNENPT